MRTLRRNKQKMTYATLLGEVPVYETDLDGNIKYTYVDGEKIPIETGEKELGYSEPKEFYSSLAMSGGESEAQEFGLSLSDYDATLICPKNAYEISEGTLVWVKSEVGFKDENNASVEPTSADYVCVKCSDSLNFTKYILKAQNK